MVERALNVLVVDDTVVYRRVLQNVVAEISGAVVVGTAANGRIALEKLNQLDVDFVLLDVEMPEMGGIETLKEIRHRWPGIGVVLLSGGDRRAADLTMTALELGALDFVEKADTGDVQRNHKTLVTHLTGVIRAFEVARRLSGMDGGSPIRSLAPLGQPGMTERRLKTAVVSDSVARLPTDATAASSAKSTVERPGMQTSLPVRRVVDVLLIGCSTGGPQALAKVIPLLPADLGVPVLVVQHMPPVFTASLAESLNRASKLKVMEGVDNQVIVANTVYVAPGGRHMIVRGEVGRGEKRIGLNDEPLVNSVRPAVDVLFTSAARCFGANTLSVVLTGMGEDGLEGVRALRKCGGVTLTQSAATCVVYGMPRAVERAGLADAVLPLDEIAVRIIASVRQGIGVRSMPVRGA